MRKALLAAVVFAACALPAFGRTTIRIWVDCDGGNGYDYVGNEDGFPSTCPPGTCNDCIVLVYQPTDGNGEGDVKANPGGGYILTGNIDRVTYTKADDRSKSSSAKPAGFVFSRHFHLTITECVKYPFLDGVSVSMDGVAVDENGTFRVYIP